MDFYTWDQRVSNLGSNGDDRSLGNSGGFSGDLGNADGVLTKSSQSLVLDEEKGELVKAEGKVIGKKAGLISDEKAVAALKSHSDAERRRRERINAHLHTFRGLIPCTDKMDKATLLAEVICQLKQLKTNAEEASIGVLMPEDIEEVIVEKLENGGLSTSFHVSLCCKHRPELLTDLRQALAGLKVKIERAELSTLGGYIKMIFDFSSTTSSSSSSGMTQTDEDLLASVRQALSSIIEKASISPEYSPRTMLPNKRRRYSL